jgi:hypothetical protein
LRLPRIFLAMPHSGPPCAEAIESFYRQPPTVNVEPEFQVIVAHRARRSFGALAANFNSLFATALDHRDAGLCSHFAMIHADVEAEGPWLNILHAQMQRRGLAALSATVAIKDRRGVTSTAVGKVGDPWHIARYIGLEDQGRIPDTFTGKDVCGEGEELLINTGCLLLDLSHPFWDSFVFRTGDDIVKRPDGGRDVLFESEDWRMSRELNAAGVPYGATWAVRTRHLNGGNFANYPEA